MKAITRAPRLLIRFFSRYWGILAVLIAWDLWLRINGFGPTVAPSPGSIAIALGTDFGTFAPPLLLTIAITLAGLAIGVVLGIVLGVLVWASPIASGLVTPVAVISRVMPMAALLPILARLLGFGTTTTIVIIAVFVFFPVFTLTGSGLRDAPASGQDLFAVAGAGRSATMLRLRLPYAAPKIMLAIRLAAPLAIAGMMLADYVTAGGGLGDLIRQGRALHETGIQWGAAILAAALSVSTFSVARAAEDAARARMT